MSQKPESPYLELVCPDQQVVYIPLKEIDYFTIGRDKDNHYPLDDPQKFISREHCRLEREKGYFWIIDDDSGASGKPSASGTFVRPVNGQSDDIDVREKGRLRLNDGDMFYLLAKVLPPDDKPVFWQFTFYDANTTHNNPRFAAVTSQEVHPVDQLTYSLASQLLMRWMGDGWEMVHIPPTPLRLIRYMVQKNQENHGQPTLCTYTELIKAVWEGSKSFGKQNRDITHLVWQIRNYIEPDPSEPQYIQNVMSDGYLLNLPVKP